MPYFAAGSPAEQAAKAESLGATVLVPETSMGGVTFSVVADPHGSTFGLLRLDS
jgi:predicted enzyme related to lactoylglutathione lyase